MKRMEFGTQIIMKWFNTEIYIYTFKKVYDILWDLDVSWLHRTHISQSQMHCDQ